MGSARAGLRSVATAAALLGAIGVAWPADGPSVRLEVTPLTRYVWRGVVLTDAPVVQTSSTVGYRGAHLNLFTNQDLNNGNGGRWRVNELDFDAGYDYDREKAIFSVGAIRYTFPHTTNASTAEVYAGVGSSLPLHPSVRGYFDVEATHGTYVTFDVFHKVTLLKTRSKVNWEAILAAGAGSGSFGMAEAHPTLTLPLTYGKVRVTPALGYGMVLDRRLHRGPEPHAHGFFGGVNLSLTL